MKGLQMMDKSGFTVNGVQYVTKKHMDDQIAAKHKEMVCKCKKISSDAFDEGYLSAVDILKKAFKLHLRKSILLSIEILIDAYSELREKENEKI